MHFIKNTALPIIALTALLIFGISSQSHAENLSKADVETIIKEYLTENPEIILDSLEQYRKAQEESFKAQTKQRIEDNLKQLTDGGSPFIGNPDGDVVVVEFFDYNCGYCKRAVPDIQELIANDKNVKVVFKEMPILSAESLEASKWALAAHKQGKYFEYHAALMKTRGRKDEKAFQNIGKDLELDVDQLTKDAKSEAINTMVEKDRALAKQIGVQGTPAFIVNGAFYPGYLGPDGLTDAIKQARDAQNG